MKPLTQLGPVAVLSLALLACTAEPVDSGVTPDEADAAAARSSADGELEVPDFPGGDAAEAPAEPEPATYTVPAGTTLTLTLDAPISAAGSQPGDGFTATLADAVVIDGVTVLPEGATATGTVVDAAESGRVRGVARLELVLSGIEVGGRAYELDTSPLVARADTERGEDAARIGTGAGIGAAIGAAVGGGDGAALGAAIGGGAGTAVVLTDRGDDVVLTADTPIGFVLETPLAVTQ